MNKYVVIFVKTITDHTPLVGDKVLHFIAGGAVATVVAIASLWLIIPFLGLTATLGAIIALVFGMIGAIIVGREKERYDYKDYGTWDKADARATELGGITSMMLLAFILL